MSEMRYEPTPGIHADAANALLAALRAQAEDHSEWYDENDRTVSLSVESDTLYCTLPQTEEEEESGEYTGKYRVRVVLERV